jgi:hypothetical protein
VYQLAEHRGQQATSPEIFRPRQRRGRRKAFQGSSYEP